MAADRTHLSLSMANTLTAGQGSQQPQQTAHVLQSQPASNSIGTEGQDNSPGQTKRGPGRPKGSTKKSLETDPSSAPKLKRPVGRPRKDGRPAGSVPKVPRGPGRPRKNFPADFAVNTFPQQQQQHPQQAHSDQEGWNPLPGMFNNYRLPKEATSDVSLPTAVNDTLNAERTNGSSETADSRSPAQQPSKWFPTNRAAASSSSSIANALIHPPSISQSAGPSHPAENVAAISSTLIPNGTREVENSANDVSSCQRPLGDTSLSIPIPQIPSFVLATVYSLFSRQSNRTLALPRDMLSAYRAHLGHLTGSQAIAYTFLKTFWLPCSPLLFRMVLPRSGLTSKSSHRNTFNRPSSSSHGTINGTQFTNGHGDAQNLRTPNADQHYATHRFFYWDPFYLSLSGSLTCPVCNQAPLSHCGPIRTGPLRVFDLPSSSTPATSTHVHAGFVPSTFYVIGMQYACSEGTCGARLASWDPRVVNSLPQVLADEWPVHLASVQAEQNEIKGMGLTGDAISRSLFTLVKTLAQAGTSQEYIRDILAKLWDWSDGDKDDDHEEGPDEDLLDHDVSGKSDNEKVAELLFASPYQRLWTAAQTAEMPAHAPLANDQRPAKRHKPNEPASGVATVMTAPPTDYSSALFGSQNPAVTNGGSSSLAIQLQPPPEHHPNGVDHRSPRPQPQQIPRPQRSQGQLKVNPAVRPQPSQRPSITHAHTSHIHTPSPIYPSTSLPNSTTNSPQTGQGTTLSLKRPLESDTHHPPSGAGPPVPPGPGQAPPQASPGQAQFPGMVHTPTFSHLRGLQHQGHAPPQQPPHPSHHHPSAGVRTDAALRMHPSLVHTSNPLSHFNPQAALHPLLATAPQASQSQAPPPQPQQHATPQRRVRHCVKCGRHDCKGKGGSQFCKNPCKDCNGMDCKGRNSKRPNATCREGW